MNELWYFEIGCKKPHFEKNDFEIHEPDFWDLKLILKHFMPRIIPKGVFHEYFEPAQYVSEVFFT